MDPSGVEVVSPAQGFAILETTDPRLSVLDVRTPEEYAEAHLEGAMLLDFYAEDFEARVDQLDRSALYLLYCRSGNRSAQARALMARLGFEEVYDIDGGIVAWLDAGLPVVSGP